MRSSLLPLARVHHGVQYVPGTLHLRIYAACDSAACTVLRTDADIQMVEQQVSDAALAVSATWVPVEDSVNTLLEDILDRDETSDIHVLSVILPLLLAAGCVAATTYLLRRRLLPYLIDGRSWWGKWYRPEAGPASAVNDRINAARIETGETEMLLASAEDTDGIHSTSATWRKHLANATATPHAARILVCAHGIGAHLLAFTALTIAGCALWAPRTAVGVGSVTWSAGVLASAAAGWRVVCSQLQLRISTRRAPVYAVACALAAPAAGCAVWITLAVYRSAVGGATRVLTKQLACVAVSWACLGTVLAVLGARLATQFASPPALRVVKIRPPLPAMSPSIRMFIYTIGLVSYMGSAVPFIFLMRSSWGSAVRFGATLVILSGAAGLVVAATSSVLLTYLLLDADYYAWQWPVTVACGSVSLYSLVGAAVYFLLSGVGGGVSALLYVMQSTVLAVAAGACAVTVGWCASYAFVVSIYSSAKSD